MNLRPGFILIRAHHTGFITLSLACRLFEESSILDAVLSGSAINLSLLHGRPVRGWGYRQKKLFDEPIIVLADYGLCPFSTVPDGRRACPRSSGRFSE